MLDLRRAASRRGLAVAVVVGLICTLSGTDGALAKATKRKTTKKKAAVTTKKKAPTTAKPAAGGAAAPVSKGTIKIGVIGSELNSRGQIVPPEAKQISKAWGEAINAAGGINGFKVEVIYKNANGDPARALNALRDLDREGVVAFTQGDAAMMPALRDYMTQKGLPVLGGQPYTNEYDWHPMFFHFAGQAIGVYGQLAAARDVGAKHFRNVYCSEVAACATSVPETKYAAEREGLRFSAEGASAVAPDNTATCLSAKNAGVDYFQSNGLTFANVVRDCARQNYHPTYAVGGLTCGISCVEQAKGDNLAGNLYEFGIFYNGPEVQRFRQALAKTEFKVDDGTATQWSVQVWLGLELIGAAIKHLPTAGVPTRQQFLDTIYTMKGETLGGQIPPTDFSVQKPGTGKHATSDCWTEHLAKDGRLYHMDTRGQVVNKLTFICGTGLKLNDKASPI